ncbi:hypothetical protein V9T40_014113 [Parthenolecanium corni]|uniref:Ubiquitin-like protease family profile domain-containing protein n=1 Tax=Parthenolecanium corni TaxID=536013 RepID=A0AAN9Y349_9HEMI
MQRRNCSKANGEFSKDENWTHEKKKSVCGGGKPTQKYNCSECDKEFSSRQALHHHRKLLHRPDRSDLFSKTTNKKEDSVVVADEGECNNFNGKVFTCIQCKGSFINARSYKRHTRNCQTISLPKNFRVECLEPTCDHDFAKYDIMLAHLERDHLKSINKENLTFQNQKDFDAWRDEIQLENYMLPVCRSGSKITNTKTYIYWVCQFDVPRSYRTLECSRWKKGYVPYIKCPARMLVHIQSNGTIDVCYISEHTHELSFKITKYHQLSPSTRSQIKLLVSWDVPNRKIEKFFQSGAKNDDQIKKLKTPYYIDGSRIRNYRAQYKQLEQYHKDDATSVDFWVEAHKSSVFIYKQLHTENFKVGGSGNIEGSWENTFILGFQNDRMLEVMKEGVNKTVCIDGTHGTNAYKFELINFVVPDRMGRGYPVVHFITNRKDEETYTLMFQHLKLKNPNLDLFCVITDDETALINGLKNVFNNINFRHILCQWHVRRAWISNINKCLDKDLQDKLVIFLDQLLYVRNRQEFLTTENEFISVYGSNEKTRKFVTYYETHYKNRKEEWALAYRNFAHDNVNTNMFVESYHRTLKYKFLNGKCNKRIDSLLVALEDAENTFGLRLEKDIMYGMTESRKNLGLKEISLAHSRGMTISEEDVSVLLPEKRWKVISQSKKNTFYVIEKKNIACIIKDHCVDICIELECEGLCSHLYSCTCPVMSNMCKHIHCIHSLLHPTSKPISERKQHSINFAQNENRLYSNQPSHSFENLPKQSTSKSLSKINSDTYETTRTGILQELEKLTKSIDGPYYKEDNPAYMSVLANLRHANDINDAINSKKTVPSLGFKVTKTPPNVKPIKQPKFHIPLQRKSKKRFNFDQLTRQNVLSSENSFTRFLYPGEEDYSKILFLIDSNIEVTKKSLKTLDLFISNEEYNIIKNNHHNFVRGWLDDTIIDAFLYLCCANDNQSFAVRVFRNSVIYGYGFFETPSAKIVTNFLEQNPIFNYIFIPCNTSGSHWTMLVVTYQNIMIFDPMHTRIDMDSALFQYAIMWQCFLTKICNRHFEIVFSDHFCQTDTFNCGVFVCWFAHSLMIGQSVTESFDLLAFRKVIYERIMATDMIDDENNED